MTAPGLGDDVQALKVGLLEIADLLVVNKGDREGADRAIADLTAMLALGARPVPPILKTTATTEAGIEDLVAALDAIAGRARPPSARPGGGGKRRGRWRRSRPRRCGRGSRRALAGASGGDPVSVAIKSVADRTLDPWSAADFLMAVLK